MYKVQNNLSASYLKLIFTNTARGYRGLRGVTRSYRKLQVDLLIKFLDVDEPFWKGHTERVAFKTSGLFRNLY